MGKYTCIAIHQYLHNWLNKQWSREMSHQDRQKTLLLCQQMGCLINWEKWELTPTQQLNFLWVHFDLLVGPAQPATEKMDGLLTKVSPFLLNQSILAHVWETLLGLLKQLEAYVLWGETLWPSHSTNPPPPQKNPHDLPVLMIGHLRLQITGKQLFEW